MKNKTRNMMLGGLAVIIAIMGWRMAGAEEDEAAVAQNSVNQTRAKYANAAMNTIVIRFYLTEALIPVSNWKQPARRCWPVKRIMIRRRQI